MLRSLELGPSERSLERKPEPLRPPSAAPSREERSSAERDRSTERRDPGQFLKTPNLTKFSYDTALQTTNTKNFFFSFIHYHNTKFVKAIRTRKCYSVFLYRFFSG